MPFDPRIIAGHALLGIVLAMAAPARAEPVPTRPRTCLVLGGGGARGAAHIGVLKVLEREHVPVDCIVGTSMGAIVGGLYAAGYSADQIDAILRGIDWKDLLEDNPPRGERSMRRKDDDLRFLGGVEIGIRDGRIALPQGMIQGQKLELLLRRLLLSTAKVGDFDHLPIPYRAIAADIATGDKVVFSRGDLATAIRASMSIPGAFAPVRLDGRMLVDGGMVDNVPVDEARKLGAERLIVVSVGAPLEREDDLDSPYAITYQMLGALMKRQTDAELATLGKDDLLIEPALGTIAAQDFHRVEEARDIGQAAAMALRSRVDGYAGTETEYAAFERNHHQLPFDAPIIAFLDVARDQSHTADYVGHRLADSVGRPLDIDAIEKSIGIAYGEGRYQSIRWQLAERDGQTGIHLEPQDKAWGPDFLRSSLRLSDDFSGNSSYQLLSELNLTGLNSLGGELRGRVGFGRLSNLHAEYYQPWGDAGQYWVSPYIDYRAYNLPLAATNRITYGEYRRSRGVGGGELGFTPDNQWQLSTRFEYGFDRAHLRIGDPNLLPNFSSHIGGVVLRATRDTLDSSGFPSTGTRLDLSYEAFLTALGSDDNARVTQFSWDNAHAYGANRWLFGLKGSWSSGGENLLATYSPLGGLTNLSGYAENTILASRTALARAIYYRRLTNTQGLLSVPVYAGASLELGMYGDSRAELTHRGPVTAGSVFLGVDTFLGPIFLGYGQAEGGVRAFYLTFGPLLRTETGY